MTLSNNFTKTFNSGRWPQEVFFKNRFSKRVCNIHWKTPVLGSLLKKFAGLQTRNVVKKRLQHRRFPVNIAKFLRTPPILKKIGKRLLLKKHQKTCIKNSFFNVFYFILSIFLYLGCRSGFCFYSNSATLFPVNRKEQLMNLFYLLNQGLWIK